MRHRRHCGVEFLEVAGQRALRINVKRRAEFSGERLDGDTFAKQIPADVTKVMHDDCSLKFAARRGKEKARRQNRRAKAQIHFRAQPEFLRARFGIVPL